MQETLVTIITEHQSEAIKNRVTFFTCVSNFLFSDFYLSLLFNFKIGRSSDLPCLLSSMFIIILIICIIKTTCFDNTVLMAEL